jgi:tetratricopeptide (TPR) repeat protein
MCGELDSPRSGEATVSKWVGFAPSDRLVDIAVDEVADLLASLVEKHLVILDESTGRFRLLESVLAYGRATLMERNEVDDARLRHRDHFLAFAEAGEQNLRSAGQVKWLALLEADHDNLRSAIRWSIDSGEGELALRLAVAVGGLWFARAHLNCEGRSWFEEALRLPGATDRTLAAAHLRMGLYTFWYGDCQVSAAEYGESLRLSCEMCDEAGMAAALNGLGCALVARDKDNDEARKRFEEALSLARKSGSRLTEASVLSNLGEIARIKGDRAAATELYRGAVDIFRSEGDLLYLAYNLVNLGTLRLEEGDVSSARKDFEESVRLSLEIGDSYQTALAVSGMVAVHLLLDHPDSAAELQGYVLAEYERTGVPLQRFDQEHLDRTVAALASLLGREDYQERVAAGRSLTALEAVDRAMCRSVPSNALLPSVELALTAPATT